MGLPTDSIWDVVKAHPWKYSKRGLSIAMVLIHSTRSGQGWSMEMEYLATQNWFMSVNNYSEDRSWASMASRIIGNGGRMCIVVPDTYYPTFSAGHLDPQAISLEICQPRPIDRFDPRDIDRAVIESAEICHRYGIPPRYLEYVSGNNRELPGIGFHDQSANGTRWGKSDPGALFPKKEFCEKVDAALYARSRQVYTDEEIDRKLEAFGQALINLRQETNELANGVDAVQLLRNDGSKLTLKGLWYVAKRRWPF